MIVYGFNIVSSLDQPVQKEHVDAMEIADSRNVEVICCA